MASITRSAVGIDSWWKPLVTLTTRSFLGDGDAARMGAAAAPRTAIKASARMSAPVGLAAVALDRDALGRQHLVLQGEHAGRGLVDLPGERDRALQDGGQAGLVLDARLRILVLHHQVGVGHVEAQQLARRQ